MQPRNFCVWYHFIQACKQLLFWTFSINENEGQDINSALMIESHVNLSPTQEWCIQWLPKSVSFPEYYSIREYYWVLQHYRVLHSYRVLQHFWESNVGRYSAWLLVFMPCWKYLWTNKWISGISSLPWLASINKCLHDIHLFEGNTSFTTWIFLLISVSCIFAWTNLWIGVDWSL